MKRPFTHKLRIPVRMIDGVIEFEYGGPLPLHHDAVAELIVDPNDVADELFVERLTRRKIVKLLPEGTELLVMMSGGGPAGIPSSMRVDARLGKWFDARRFPAYPDFIRIRLGELLPWQEAPDDSEDGGLWLETVGMRTVKMISSSIEVDGLSFPGWINSLNHAYTLLSERFEPQRISHTGNVYERVMYKERDGLWYPLKLFRNGEIADEQHEIAMAFWNNVKVQLTSPEKDQ